MTHFQQKPFLINPKNTGLQIILSRQLNIWAALAKTWGNKEAFGGAEGRETQVSAAKLPVLQQILAAVPKKNKNLRPEENNVSIWFFFCSEFFECRFVDFNVRSWDMNVMSLHEEEETELWVFVFTSEHPSELFQWWQEPEPGQKWKVYLKKLDQRTTVQVSSPPPNHNS